jgi:hypothetical protein
MKEASLHQHQVYRRGQAEWALWKFATLDLPSGDEPVSAFRARVKHLLQLDRAGALFRSARSAPPVPHALSSAQTLGTGVDAEFTAFDVFCLAIAVDFLRAGFKQSEVVLLMGYLRVSLLGPFDEILANPPAFRSRLGRKSEPAVKREHDRRVFLVIQRVEFSEAFPSLLGPGRQRKGAIFREPLFCRGIDELYAELDKMDHLYRRAIVLEIANMAARIVEFLEQAPLMRRGRASRER